LEDPQVSELQQLLQLLGKEQFESLVHQALLAKYPGADIKKVDGSGGDEGIDSFSGMLDVGPAIWQVSTFRSASGTRRKERLPNLFVPRLRAEPLPAGPSVCRSTYEPQNIVGFSPRL
jgi:hypothetical protein